jgi:hypothetical protein
MNNIAWAGFNIGVFMPFIFAAIPRGIVNRYFFGYLYKLMFIPERAAGAVNAVKLKVVSRRGESDPASDLA